MGLQSLECRYRREYEGELVRSRIRRSKVRDEKVMGESDLVLNTWTSSSVDRRRSSVDEKKKIGRGNAEGLVKD